MKVVLLLTLSFIILLYIPLNRQIPRYRLNLRLDNHVPLIPWTVWIYISYYLLLPISVILIWNSRYIIPLLSTQIIATSLASLIWKIFPNGVSRPVIGNSSGYSFRVLELLYYHDRDCNGLPSGHILHTFISCYFLSLLFPQLWLAFYVILLAISLSTITTKQHYFLDMVTTLALTPLIIELSSIIHL